MLLRLDRHASPIGTILLATDGEDALRALDFEDFESRMHRLLRLHYGGYSLRPGAAPRTVTEALDAYFGGDLGVLDGLDVRTAGTAFQRKVWVALRRIAPGEVVSYGTLAARLGCPTASRAVGAANGANPVALIVPCHRVIAASGGLGGYGGGIERKAWLLRHEGAMPIRDASRP